MMRLLILFIFVCVTSAKIEKQELFNNNYIVENNDDVYVAKPRKYHPDWKDLDTRRAPQWYDRAKVGIFLHWGVFSVPSFYSEWFWVQWKSGKKNIKEFMQNNYPPGFTYQDFAPLFTAEFFDPESWASLFLKSGAKYVVLTSKHHEGYTLFPSTRSFSWNSKDVGPHRDLVGDLATAVKEKGMKFGLYHSLFEWFNPMYLEDKGSNFTKRTYVESKLWPDLKQLINDYKPSVLWSDGDWEAYDNYWKSTEFLAWLYNESPVKDEVLVNDRWGIGIPCNHGDFYNCQDRYNPNVLQNHKWENAFTIDSESWGYRRNMDLSDVLTMNKLLKNLISTVSCGGNVLINVGPTKEGTIPVIFQERLLALGQWLEVNGEAIYNTSPWFHQNDTINNNVWYTCTKFEYNDDHPTAVPELSDTVEAVYAIILKWPKNNKIKIKDITPLLHSGNYKVQMLGVDQNLQWTISNGDSTIELPDKGIVSSEDAWVLKVFMK